MSNPQVVCGRLTGTGALINVSLGFIPDKVTLLNETSGRTVTWFVGQGAGKGVAAGTLVTTNGISAYAGDANTPPGFTIGTDAVNTNTNPISYDAIRSGPGAK